MAKSKIRVDLFYDVISPYSWVAFELLCRNRSVWNSMQLNLRPFLLGAIMKESGNKPPMFVENKSRYMMNEFALLNKYYQIPLKIPSNFTELAIKKGSLRAMRFVTATDLVTNSTQTEHVSRELWKRIFTNEPGLDISEESSFREVADKLAFESSLFERILKAMDEDETKQRLKQNTEEALREGAFGAPTILVHKADTTHMLFGSDKIELLAFLLGEKYMGPLTEHSKL
ncbi:Glutathione S-transferase kappa 1-like protein [Dinothrombium tinctorium]|uniref:Glutathione S-transferase kappa n=1 Tax=Dinothrombium tinctorium TaxID=1965070 RepID=A0A3S3RJ66_9ACAR|nr:Glutathione S-transferase kappa 1-like protein [Dinothrombium tinctorium]